MGIALAMAACASERADTGAAAVELTAAQCDHFAVGGRVTVCHESRSPRHPYTVVRATVAACRLHVLHPGDYIGYQDPTCNGQGCFPEGAPYDGSVECCAGLTGASGTCLPLCANVVTDDGDACTIDACDPQTGAVTHVADATAAGCACAADRCPLDPAKTAPGLCGCGLADDETCGGACADVADADADGTADCVDQCAGAPDVDSDGDGVADCLDGCPADPGVINAADVESCGATCTFDSPDLLGVSEDGTVVDGPDCIPDCMQAVGCPTCPSQT